MAGRSEAWVQRPYQVNVPEYRAVSDDANALQAAMAEALTLHCKGLTYRRKRGDAVEEPEGPEPTVMEEEEEKESEEEEEEEIIIVKLTEKEEEIDLKLVADTATAIAALGDEPVAGYTVWAKANGFPRWPAKLVTLEGLEPRAMKNGPGRERRLSGHSLFDSKSVFYGGFLWVRRARNGFFHGVGDRAVVKVWQPDCLLCMFLGARPDYQGPLGAFKRPQCFPW